MGACCTSQQLSSSGIVRCEGQVYVVPQLLEPEHYPTVAALAGVDRILAALERIAQGFVNDEDYALAEDQWDCAGCLESELQKIGLGQLGAEASTEALSSGERQRIALLGAWLSKADWLIPDEPSNHFDRDGQIEHSTSGLIVISHDRDLLEHVDEIVELFSAHGLVAYGGNYSQYSAQREQVQQAFETALKSERAQAKREQREMVKQMERQQRRNARGERHAQDVQPNQVDYQCAKRAQ